MKHNWVTLYNCEEGEILWCSRCGSVHTCYGREEEIWFYHIVGNPAPIYDDRSVCIVTQPLTLNTNFGEMHRNYHLDDVKEVQIHTDPVARDIEFHHFLVPCGKDLVDGVNEMKELSCMLYKKRTVRIMRNKARQAANEALADSINEKLGLSKDGCLCACVSEGWDGGFLELEFPPLNPEQVEQILAFAKQVLGFGGEK